MRKGIFKEDKNAAVFIVFLLLLMVGSFLRFYNLGKLDFWVDEPYHVYSAKSLNENDQPLLPSGLSYNRAPIYTRLVAWSFKIFGVDEFSARFPSALFGVLDIVLIFFVGKVILKREIGLLAAFFLAFSYYALAWSRISRFYTLFQFIYLLSVFIFYKGFEYKSIYASTSKKDHYMKNLGIHWFWIILACLLFYTAYTIHLNTVMFFPTIGIYVSLLTVYYIFRKDFLTVLKSKYIFAILGVLVIFILGYIFFNLGSLLKWGFSYRPSWADLPKFRNRYYYYNYLTSSTIFPLSAFFLIGVFHTLTRLNKGAFYILINFLVPFGITSLFFSYKLSNYIFHVYPFYLLIGAYGVVNLYDDGVKVIIKKLSVLPVHFKKLLPSLAKVFVSIVLFAWIPLTPWFKLGIRFPRLKAGQYNLVFTQHNWKWAADYVNQNRSENDVVISTIPLTLMYYGLRSDYNLNNGVNNIAKEEGMIDAQNRLIDPYSGIRTILNLDELKKIIKENPSGWIVTDNYTISLKTCVSEEMAQFISKNLKLETKNKTILIYRWD